MKSQIPPAPGCSPEDHDHPTAAPPRRSAAAFERAAAIFRVMGDVSRLRLLTQLAAGERCVTDLASGDGLSTVSQRLRLLRAEGLVRRRRQGKHIFYSLSDGHVAGLIANALEHADEAPAPIDPEEDEP